MYYLFTCDCLVGLIIASSQSIIEFYDLNLKTIFTCLYSFDMKSENCNICTSIYDLSEVDSVNIHRLGEL